MSKFKLVLAVFLFFGTFSNLQASELGRLCGFSSPAFGSAPVVQCDEESGIIYYGGPNCDNQVYMSIYFANLGGYNNLPFTGVEYFLPLSMPVLYVQLDTDNDGIFEETIDSIDGFFYNGYKVPGTAAQGLHYIFEHKIDITNYFNFATPCVTGADKVVGVRIMKMGSYGLELFDPLPFGNTQDIISCEVFHETCSLCLDREGNPIALGCEADSSLPEYEFTICSDCTTDCSSGPGINRGVEIDNQFAETKFIPVISPNPFSNEVTVEFQTQKENTPTEIEIYDWTGALVVKKSFSSEIGKRKISIDMTKLPQGVYYLNLTTDDTRTTSKIIKL